MTETVFLMGGSPSIRRSEMETELAFELTGLETFFDYLSATIKFIPSNPLSTVEEAERGTGFVEEDLCCTH
jgi:hypothetical protein